MFKLVVILFTLASGHPQSYESQDTYKTLEECTAAALKFDKEVAPKLVEELGVPFYYGRACVKQKDNSTGVGYVS